MAHPKLLETLPKLTTPDIDAKATLVALKV